jgi:ribonuclease P protein subunit POP4
MALTPETLTRHELNGLRVTVVEATNPDLVGIAGRVVVETMKTLHVDCGADDDGRSRVRQVPKQGATLEFEIPAPETGTNTRTDEAAGDRKVPGSASEPQRGEGAVHVTVDGARLLSRPALRTENAGESTWR